MKILSKNTEIRHIWPFSFNHKILQLDKFEGVNFKYDNIISKFYPKNNQTGHFFVSNLKSFIFVPNFATRQFERR